MSLAQAITQLQAEVTSYGQGTLTQPLPRSTEWFLLRAKAVGLSLLKQLQQDGVELDLVGAERRYLSMLRAAKTPAIEDLL